MTTSFIWVTSVVVAIITISQIDCEGVAVHGKKKERQPAVEIIELTLSQRPNESENSGFGIQKVPQESAPNYEILITPNKNHQEVKGSQEIKIFVKASNFDEGEKTGELPRPEQGKREKHDAVPLSIENAGFNVDRNRYVGVQTGKLNTHAVKEEFPQRDSQIIPNKRQNFANVGQDSKPGIKVETVVPNRQSNLKEKFITGDHSYVDQNNPYHPVRSPVNEERPRQPTNDEIYSSINQNSKRVVQQTFVEDYPVAEEQSRPQGWTNRPGKHETDYEEKPVYVDHSNSNWRPEETKPLKSVYSEEIYRPAESQNPGYNERRPNFGKQPHESRPSYTREPEEEPYYNQRRPVYGEEEPSEDKEVEDGPYKGPNYEEETDPVGYDSHSRDFNRTIRDNKSKYSGFPESAIVNNNYNSRPLQYDPPRAFPASPCLNVFKYEGREPEEDHWTGAIHVYTDEVLNGMRLDVTLDKPAQVMANWLAEVKTNDNMHFTLLSLTHKLLPGPPEIVRILVRFDPNDAVPFVKTINLNGRLICPSNRAQKTTTKIPVYENPGELVTRRTTEAYLEKPKRPLTVVQEPQSNTKRPFGYNERTTYQYEESNRKTTPRPPTGSLRPVPNGYDGTDQNSFSSQTKKPPSRPANPNGYDATDQNSYSSQTSKPPSGRPGHSNGKPPPHAAKPAQGQSHGNSQGHGQGQGHNKNPSSSNKNPSNSNKNPSSPNKNPSNSNKNPSTPSKNPPSGSKPSSGLSVSQGSQNGITCGVPSVQPRPLITHGQQTARGQWPWHVALYKNVGTDLSFFCGGSLINNKYVLTAAHCVTKTYTNRPIDESVLVVVLGKYHLNLWSEGGAQNRQVDKIFVYPKYNSTNFECDIAVLELSTPVEFSDYIRPICLWDRSKTGLEDLIGKEGTVVGWGFDENRKLTEELRQAKMPVIDQETCLRSYPDFYPQFTSNMTFCAGFRNGTSACNGDSGGGMVFRLKDSRGPERWHLRGIVSISPGRNDAKVCDNNHYVVFTDAAKFLPWLDKFI